MNLDLSNLIAELDIKMQLLQNARTILVDLAGAPVSIDTAPQEHVTAKRGRPPATERRYRFLAPAAQAAPAAPAAEPVKRGRRPWTDAEKAAFSLTQKAAWKRRKAKERKAAK